MDHQHAHDAWAYVVIIGFGIVLGLWLLSQSVLLYYAQPLLDTILKISVAGFFIIGSYVVAIQNYNARCSQKTGKLTGGIN